MKSFLVCLLFLAISQGTSISPNYVINDLTGVSSELYGGAVGLSGSLLVVGASDKTIDFESQGAAILYHCDKNQCTFFTQLTAFDAAEFDNYGYSVAVDGTIVVIGANSKAVGVNEFQGAVYVYDCPTTGCTLLSKLTAPSGQAFDDFGASVAVSGNLVVVGADQVTVNGNEGQGQALLFQCNAGSNVGTCGWLSTLDCASCNAGDLFGYSVAISGNFVTVGAPFSSIGSVDLQGQALGFDCTNPAACVPLGAVTTLSGEEESFFGWAVSASGWHALIGSPFENSTSAAGQGAVYPVDCTGGSCVTQSALYSSDGTDGDNFGSSVAMSGNAAILSSSGRSAGSGAAYLFDCTIFSACKQTRQYGFADLHPGDAMGAAVTISANLAAIGVPGHSPSGLVQIFGAPTPTCASLTEGNANWPRGTLSTRVTGTCVTGWIGAPTRDCQLDSTYGPISNPCIPATSKCAPETYGYANWTATTPNTVATGTCIAGYSGTPSRKCTLSAVWSTSVTNLCTKNFCGPLNDGNAVYNKTWAFQSTYGTCAPGLSGRPSRYCDANGNWGAVTNPCSSNDCPQETYGNNVFQQTPIGQTAVGTCVSGYRGTPYRQCFSTGWSTNVVNNCARITCASTIAGNANFPTGNSGTLVAGKCITGVGNPKMICNITGQWTSLTGPCL